MKDVVGKALFQLRRETIRQLGSRAAELPEAVRERLELAGSLGGAVPSEDQLRSWAVATPLDFQAWCFHHSFVTRDEWLEQRRMALARPDDDRPLLSIVTPVHDTPASFLRECVYSVRAQSYPFWELCLVDDASVDPDTRAELERLAASDARIRLEHLDENRGICGATNVGIEMAVGDYVGFVDHDDRLAPDALHHVAGVVSADRSVDVVYSDRDMLSPKNVRCNHTLKPGWAPETLLAGNYLFHFTLYRRTLLMDLGGYRAEYEGSQDFDLALRASEKTSNVAQIPRVLYHWRQHEGSMALLPDAKPHIFETGVAALAAALERRGIDGVAEENPLGWRGNYRVRLAHRSHDSEIVRVDHDTNYRDQVQAAVDSSRAAYMVVLGPGVEPEDDSSIDELLAWFALPHVAAVTGRIVSSGGWLRHGGLVRSVNGPALAPYEGHRRETPGYLAMTVTHRNVSLVHPHACAWRLDDLRRAGGLADTYRSPVAMIDASIAVTPLGRTVYTPLATFVADDRGIDLATWPTEEWQRIVSERSDALADEPYYHWAFDRERVEAVLYVGAPDRPVDW
jgi:O-antigen biosynthesis protein